MAAQPGGSGNVALREFVLGHAQSQLNLAAVRARAEELRRSLDQIIQQLQFAADRVQWADALDRFAVINVQHQHLLDALRPMLRQFAAYPRSVNQSNAPILPIMLATKLLPEMEAEERTLLAGLGPRTAADEGAAAAAAAGAGAADWAAVGGPTPGVRPLESLPLAEQFAWVADQERQLNHLIDALAGEEGGPLAPKSERRRELQAAAARASAAAAAAAAPAAPQQQAVQPPGQPQRPQGPPPDPLLAAVTFGAGLS